jgi:hypothetical protein
MRVHQVLVLTSLIALIAACGAAPSVSTPPDAPSNAAPSVSPVASSPDVTDAPGPSPTVGVSVPHPSPIAVLPLECDGSSSADVDYPEDASGGNPDLEAATRELRGVRWSDTIAVDGFRSGVIRDGRGIFSGLWFRSTSGGWLLSAYDICGGEDVPVWAPFGLVRDAMAEVVVDGGVRVRSLPTVDPSSVKYEPLLVRGDEVFIVDGPVSADGYEWYLVQSLPGGTSGGPFGWVAAASRDGETWIDDLGGPDCPSLPGDARRLGVLPEELLVHCYGGTERTFELDANVYCLQPEGPAIEPAWLGMGCGLLSGDACGSCGIPIAVDPQFGMLPREELARWSFAGHFDDPAAATCRLAAPSGIDDPSPELVVHRCRTTFVLTSLVRLGDASG